MTNEQILNDILNDCVSNWQTELAQKYHVSRSDISKLLQECGFINRKFSSNEPIDIDKALENPKVKEICEKISREQKTDI